MFKINKWHKGQSGKGYVVELCFRDEETGEWHNAKMYVPDASQYAGSEEKPAALAGVGKDGSLIIKCYRRDSFNGNGTAQKKKPTNAQQEQLPDPSQGKGKGKGNVTLTPAPEGIDKDIPF